MFVIRSTKMKRSRHFIPAHKIIDIMYLFYLERPRSAVEIV